MHLNIMKTPKSCCNICFIYVKSMVRKYFFDFIINLLHILTQKHIQALTHTHYLIADICSAC